MTRGPRTGQRPIRGHGLAALVAALPLGLPAAPALAQDATAPSIGVVTAPILILDQDRLYAESLFGRTLEAGQAQALADLQAENRRIEAELIAEERALTDKRGRMTAEAFRPLAEAFDAKVEKIRTEQEAKSKALQEAREKGRQRFFQAALPILAELMRQRGALAILSKSGVLLSFDAIDVTEAAIAALDAGLGDGGALPPAP